MNENLNILSHHRNLIFFLVYYYLFLLHCPVFDLIRTFGSETCSCSFDFELGCSNISSAYLQQLCAKELCNRSRTIRVPTPVRTLRNIPDLRGADCRAGGQPILRRGCWGRLWRNGRNLAAPPATGTRRASQCREYSTFSHSCSRRIMRILRLQSLETTQ